MKSTTFKEFVNGTVVQLADAVVNFLIVLTFLVFLYGVLKFFFQGGGEAKEKGKKFIVSGLIGFVVLFGVWGLVRLVISTLALPSA